MNVEELGAKKAISQRDFRHAKFEYVPSADGVDSNLIIYLHGLGDNISHFVNLSKKLRLPQTASLVLQGPVPVPFFDEARMWYQSFDMLGNLIQSPDPRIALNLLNDLIYTLTSQFGWDTRNIHLFGFAQGGSVAVEFARSSNISLGSVVNVLGPLLSYATGSSKTATPICIFTRPSRNVLDSSNFNKAFSKVTIFEGDKAGDEMPKDPQEWSGILKFWSDTLSTAPVSDQSGQVYKIAS
ncbi:hypothetical protein E3P92_01060 [Wallemia ichthyophaga]|uniref:Phospholipase/carboxylesterase/thioesterase domain-containing protein n=2 Tax=Wallemia ichthyophaga TaxID=245174 RepID=A0A4T0HU00_WALIC|nr:uncharacterized protein J056_000400 [Wallemia ichthyophaga EXF-994]TIA70093.1 hypothetical protein E3P91_03279 [Wallemia ichthyophaga]EOR04647.1 hypothetical protein J056_000400 [Wallemia ichthyophaga EXF-994]TIA79541.1 hypothetical protein E3P98_03225 [Wallemia ichthyophaga]TIB02390.1 hypothetical protein E3P95_01011 [Wallemia ichthyophaga]TIB03279.1 hypothetical protein E3P94_01143 [Wallemia ichthyophaga]